MEMKENIYPNLPTERNTASAPSIELSLMNNDNGHSYRSKKVSEIQSYLENEVKVRDGMTKKYLKITKGVDNVDTVLITIAMAAGAGGIGLLSTVVALPAVIGLEASALTIGLASMIGKYIVRTTRTKSEKHLRIKMLAESKLDTLTTHISKAFLDNHISDDEFKLIMEELDKYKAMKNEIRTKSKKKMTAEDQESLIEKGGKKCESFRKLVEKNRSTN